MSSELIVLIVAMALSGAAIGTFTGLVPGIHVNTLATIMLVSYPSMNDILSFIPEEHLAISVSSCIVSAAVVHSFVDYVPSVFIGAPDATTVVSMLPGHRLLSNGRGMAAVRSAAIGSCIGACSSVLLAVPFQFLLISGLDDYLDSLTLMVIIIVLLIMVLRNDSPRDMAWSAALIIISGVMGLICMDLPIPCDGILGEGTLLFPLLTGLFGMPSMLQSMRQGAMPVQTDAEKYPVGPLPGIKGVITGSITGWYPGITSTTGAVISGEVTPEKTPEGFISMTASIGTAAAVMMIVTLSVSGKGRSGAMLAVSEILGNSAVGTMNQFFVMLLLSSAIAALIGYHVTIGCGKIFSKVASNINAAVLNGSCIALVLILVVLMTGPFGLIILAASTAIGFIPISAGTDRLPLTGCLLLPTLLTYLGIRDAVLLML